MGGAREAHQSQEARDEQLGLFSDAPLLTGL